MKLSPCRLLFLFAWLLAVTVQLIVIARAPNTTIISGVEVAHANTMVLIHQMIPIGIATALAIVAFFVNKWGPLIVLVGSILYLLHWFPFQSVHDIGLLMVVRSRILLGSNPGLRLPFVTRDIVLPIIFLASIVTAVLELRRQRQTVRP